MSNQSEHTTAILIPFKGDPQKHLYACLATVQKYVPHAVKKIVVDDGSDVPLVLDNPNIILLRHEKNRGPAAARNTGIHWCLRNSVDLVILLDADCLVSEKFVETHIELHQYYLNIPCVGGSIQGEGIGFWARLDGLMSWFTSFPHEKMHVVKAPLHLPTTNLSLKLNQMFSPLMIFNEELRTGEDVAFVQNLRKEKYDILFSPLPTVIHCDRDTFSAFFKHQYAWGRHTYHVRFANKKLKYFGPYVFVFLFVLAFPCYVLYATYLNAKSIVRLKKSNSVFILPMMMMYAFKGLAIIEGALFPSRAKFKNES